MKVTIIKESGEWRVWGWLLVSNVNKLWGDTGGGTQQAVRGPGAGLGVLMG